MDEGKPVPPGETGAWAPGTRDAVETGPSVPRSEPSDAVPAEAPARAQDPVADGEPGRAAPGGADRPGEPAGGPSGEAGTGGDFELERPAAVRPAGVTGSGPESEPSHTAPTGSPAAAADTEGGAAEAAGEGSGVEAAPRPDSAGHPVPAAGDERPEPLHDPDPYDTPPYGEPGPWAPAPPVQHPAAPRTHGMAPPPRPAPGTPMPPVPSAQAPTAPAAPVTAAPDTPMPTAHRPPGGAPPMPSAPAAVGAPLSAPPAPDAPPGPGSAPYPAANPWQNYDPWAPAAPFQQSGAAVPTREQRRRRGRRALVLGALAIALLSGGIGGVVGTALERNGGIGGVRLPQAGPEPTGRASDSIAGIAARALPSVVTLHVKGADSAGTGTGFVLDGRGHILTNNHVVEPAGTGGQITVTFNGGETAKATVVGRDAGYDLAVVKVGGVHGLRPMPLGNSDNVRVGDPVVAIGAPFDLAGTVTSGIISAKERPITAGGEKGDGSDVSYVDALQTDAPINPGNSGGPLLDSRGRVVGINSAIRSAGSGLGKGGQAGSIGLGFAIPVNQARRVAEELINTGRATHPVIGVTLDMSYSGDGARVGTEGAGGGPAVSTGGPGHQAGIEPGDVITEVDGVRVHSGEELIVRTRAHRPGDRLELAVLRNGTERRITLVLGSADSG
ncbi:trypsin-like peptidase domain-containing protein [Streptomyces nodosus]